MAVATSYPGVYVVEEPSGVRTIVGVATSTALFIGRAKSGPMFSPTLCLSYGDFERAFSSDASVGELARQVKLFYLNGGTRAWILRIAKDATAAEVTLLSEGATPADRRAVLELTAKNAGLVGENIRAVVTYAGPQPEATFNVELFRFAIEGGRRVQKDVEKFRNLSMNPASPLYAPAVLTQQSALVNAEPGPDIAAMPAGNGFSLSGRAVPHEAPGASFQAAWAPLLGDDPSVAGNNFEISVDGRPYVPVSLSAVSVTDDPVAVGTAIAAAIQDAHATRGMPGVTVGVAFVDGPLPGTTLAPATKTTQLRIASTAGGDVFIRPAGTADLATKLLLGTAQGGIEVGAYAGHRPAPSGVTHSLGGAGTLTNYLTFAGAAQKDVDTLRIQSNRPDGTLADVDVSLPLVTTSLTGDEPMFLDRGGGFDGVREKLRLVEAAVNAAAATNSAFAWRAEVWGQRLALVPLRAADNFTPATLETGPTVDLGGAFTANTLHYSLGASGLGGYQTPAAVTASDGTPPLLPEYEGAFRVADSQIDLFNLMVLPPDDASSAPAVDFKDLWGPASVFCQKRRAFLLMDAPASWNTVQKAAAEVGGLRVGLVKDHAALFYPRLVVSDGGRRVPVGPSGAIAGLMARIDGSRGVWKAPAGVEADLRGVVGLERSFSDDENGVLNPRAINTARVFPNGVVNWGARTMDGDDDFASEYKYVPIRRLALFIEESLYRGLKWVVFEPNDEGLWAQIRLNAGAFMNNLFRQGAFQGQRPRDAYFVKCDAETTPQNDRNLGIVNVWVGFAPLKPAEFVILHLQQMAGQIQV